VSEEILMLLHHMTVCIDDQSRHFHCLQCY
jgi:hypothetical protein